MNQVLSKDSAQNCGMTALFLSQKSHLKKLNEKALFTPPVSSKREQPGVVRTGLSANQFSYTCRSELETVHISIASTALLDNNCTDVQIFHLNTGSHHLRKGQC